MYFFGEVSTIIMFKDKVYGTRKTYITHIYTGNLLMTVHI